jgi:hypothetical protein
MRAAEFIFIYLFCQYVVSSGNGLWFQDLPDGRLGAGDHG